MSPDLGAAGFAAQHTGNSPVWRWALMRGVLALAWVAAASVSAQATAAAQAASTVDTLLAEALAHNPEIAAAGAESDAARERVAPAGALEDPMLEAGIVSVPLPISLRRDDMTMKMLGLSQKLPFPGKRRLRHDVAAADAASVAHARRETVNRIVRDVRVAYEELRLTLSAQRLVGETLGTLRQLVPIAASRYTVGQASQSDALQAQIQVVRMQQERLRLEQEEALRRSTLRRLLGRREAGETPIAPEAATLLDLSAAPEELQRAAEERRPQLKAFAALIERSERELALARREYYPDFEVRFNYGLRGRTPDGMQRDDLVTLTVEVNLPLWRKARLEPRVAAASAMRAQARNLAEAQRLETRSALERELANVQQQRASAILFRSTLLPQTGAAFESALAAYRVGRVDFLTLSEARVRIYEAALGEAQAIAGHNKAIAEIDFLTGRALAGISPEDQQP